MPRKRQASPRDELRGLEAVAREFTEFRPAAQVLRRVRSVPTRFVQLDYAFGVRGLPIDRAGLLHGPSSEGKTVLSLGLLDSFVTLDHLARLIDAERTTTITWCEGLMGRMARHPFFGALRPDTYEQAREAVLKDFTTLRRLREVGKVPEHTSGLVVVDSIRKLTPKGIFDTIAAEARGKGPQGRFKKKGIDGMGGRAGMIKAAMNASWMDELTALLDDCGCAFLAIARETKAEEGEGFEVYESGKEHHVKVGGGQALYYDASYVLRTEHDSYVWEERDGKKRAIAERFQVSIRKLKVTGKKEPVVRCYFHVSNGVLHPEGFDRPRDVLELAERLGVAKTGGGGWVHWGGTKVGQGREAVVAKLHADPARLRTYEAEVRERFAEVAPETEGAARAEEKSHG